MSDTVPVLDLQSSALSASVLKLPPEIMFEILSLLDVQDLLNVRQTCTDIARLSQDRSVWLRMLLTQRSQVPVPPPYDGNITKSIDTLNRSALANLVMSIHHIEQSWLLPRDAPIPLGISDQATAADSFEHSGNTASLTEVLGDRWLLAVYNKGLVRIWDLHVDGIIPCSTYRRAGLAPETKRCFSLDIPIVNTLSSACASLSEDTTTLHIAVVSEDYCTVLDVRLPTTWNPNVTGAYEHILDTDRVWQLPCPALTIRALHSASKVAFFSYSDTLVLLQWECGKTWKLHTIEQMIEEDLWTGVIAARFISPYHILCVKTHALELLTLPSAYSSHSSNPSTCHVSANAASDEYLPTKFTTHFLSGLTFRGVSMSEAEVSMGSLGAEILARVSFLAYDILRGLFHYRVSLLLPSNAGSKDDSPPPHMAVRLLAEHRLAQLHSTTGEAAANVPRSRSGFTPGSRGFVSACILGRTGKRGVWIERRRGSMRRSVIAFSSATDTSDEEGHVDLGTETTSSNHEDNRPDSDLDNQGWTLLSEAKPIDGRAIFEVNSYDLRDDITHCAFAESTGAVILGNRKGVLQIL